MSTPRRIAVVSTSRSELGIMSGIIDALAADPRCALTLFLSGGLLDGSQEEFTKKVLRSRPYAREVQMHLDTGSAARAAESVGAGYGSFARAYEEAKTDILLVTGDRYELMAAIMPAVLQRIPIAHIHGGEITAGAIDEYFRHAFTKLSTFHFTTTEEHRRRVLQLGENPAHVWYLGSPSLDYVYQAPYLSREELERRLGRPMPPPAALITIHPETLNEESAVEPWIEEILAGIERSGVNGIFTEPASDVGSGIILSKIRDFVAGRPDRFAYVPTLGTENYFGWMRHVDVMVGNSSSGLIEAPSCNLAVINIGSRQQGRVRAGNVKDVAADAVAIAKAVQRFLPPAPRPVVVNPYAGPNPGLASRSIAELLASVGIIDAMCGKTFHDLPK